MKQLILLLTLIFTLGTATNSQAQTTKKHRTYKKHRVAKSHSHKVHHISSGSSSSSREIHIGPRGGRYYINSNGNKTYIK